MEPGALIAFIAASIVVLVVPGPTVTVIVANSLRHGTAAGFANIAGTQLGVLSLFGLLALGFDAIAVTLAWAFDWLRLAGAGYLLWLGSRMLMSNGTLGTGTAVRARSLAGFFWQGFFVILSNPKMLFFLGGFLPQFVDPTADVATQVMALGALFVVLATALDGCYALAAGRAGSLLTRRNVRVAEIVGGSALVGGGFWMALQGRAS